MFCLGGLLEGLLDGWSVPDGGWRVTGWQLAHGQPRADGGGAGAIRIAYRKRGGLRGLDRGRVRCSGIKWGGRKLDRQLLVF